MQRIVVFYDTGCMRMVWGPILQPNIWSPAHVLSQCLRKDMVKSTRRGRS